MGYNCPAGPGRRIHVLSTTIVFLVLLIFGCCGNHETDTARTGLAPSTAPPAYQGGDLPGNLSTYRGGDSRQCEFGSASFAGTPFSTRAGITGTATPCSDTWSNGRSNATIALVQSVQSVVEEKHNLLPRLWKKGILPPGLLHAEPGARECHLVNSDTTVAKYSNVDVGRKLAVRYWQQTQIAVSAEPPQGQGERQRQGQARWWETCWQERPDCRSHRLCSYNAGSCSATSTTDPAFNGSTAGNIGGLTSGPTGFGGTSSLGCSTRHPAVIAGGFATGAGQDAWRPRVPRHAAACQGAAPRCASADKCAKRSAEGTTGKTKLCVVLGCLYRPAGSNVGATTARTGQGHSIFCGGRSQMVQAAVGCYHFSGHVVGRGTTRALGLGGYGHREEQARGCRRGPLEGGRGRRRAQATSKAADHSPQSGSGLSGSSQGLHEGHIQNSQTDCKGRRGRRYCAPSEGPDLSCLSAIRNGPLEPGVLEWTHSVVYEADFTSQFAAQAIGLSKAFVELLCLQHLPHVSPWIDVRTKQDCQQRRLGVAGADYGQHMPASGTTGHQADMDNTSLLRHWFHPRSHEVPHISAVQAQSAPFDEPRAVVHTEVKFVHSSRGRKTVSFSPDIDFWFPGPNQLRRHSGGSARDPGMHVPSQSGPLCASALRSPVSRLTTHQSATQRFAKRVTVPCAATPSVQQSQRRIVPSAASSAVPAEDTATCPFPVERAVTACAPALFLRRAGLLCLALSRGIRFWLSRTTGLITDALLRLTRTPPALARPAGRALGTPLPGLFLPQIVLTRQVPTALFQTIVCDLRPIGADLRTEDIRIGRSVTSIVDREGVLEPLMRILQVSPDMLSFAVNRVAVSHTYVLDFHTETITVHWAAADAAWQPRRWPTQPDEPDSEPGTGSNPKPIGLTGGTRWSSGSNFDHRAYRPLRPPTPPIPPDEFPNVSAVDRAVLAGHTFTVFDTYHHMRILPRHAGQHLLDLVEVALSLTPGIRRPWNHRVLEHTWDDLPKPQLVIWGPAEHGFRVVPVRDLGVANPAEAFCTVSVPDHSSPFQAMVIASEACPSFTSARVAIARSECHFLVDRQHCPPYEAGTLRAADIAEVQPRFAPHAAISRVSGRWQPRPPAELEVLMPWSREDLWPVTEVVVHFSTRAPGRFQLPFGSDVAVLKVQICQALRIPTNCVFRLPTHCPAEAGCPLHLFLHVPEIFDPWNDPPHEPEQHWAIVDVRRCVSPPRPAYVVIPIPTLIDFQWIRNCLCQLMPEQAAISAAFLGTTALRGFQSPDGHTSLITVFPRTQRQDIVPGMMNSALDTSAVAGLRGGCARALGITAPRRFLPTPSATASGQGRMQPDVVSRGYPAVSPMLLSCVPDEDAMDYDSEEVLLLSPGYATSVCHIPHHYAPAAFHARAAQHLGLEGRSTIHIPMLTPLQPGHPRTAVVVSTNIALDRRFVIVDARRVLPASVDQIWLQESPQTLNPVITIAMLRSVQPTMCEMGVFYLDCVPMRGYVDLTCRVSLLTVMPATFSFSSLPAVFQNSRMVRLRLGFMSHFNRYVNRQRTDVQVTSTSTTTTITAVTDPERGAGAISIWGKLVRFFLAGPDGHMQAGTLHGDLPLEDVLAQLCIQLADANHLLPGLVFRANERVVSDFDQGFSVFVTASHPAGSDFAWLDARRFGVEPRTFPLPFVLTLDTLTALCGVALPDNVFVAINGAPWPRKPVRLGSADIVVVGFRRHHLWTLPPAALDRRVAGLASLLVPHTGPSPTSRVVTFHDDTRSGSSRRVCDFAGLHVFWASTRLAWEDATAQPVEDGGRYARFVLVAADIPPFPAGAATRFVPSAADVNLWWHYRFAPQYGDRTWRDAGMAFGELTVLYADRLDATSRRPWVICIDDDVDVVIAGTDGTGLELWPAPEGWTIVPIFTAGPIGQAALQRVGATPATVFDLPIPGGPVVDVSSTSSEAASSDDVAILEPPAAPDPVADHLQDLIQALPVVEDITQDPVPDPEVDAAFFLQKAAVKMGTTRAEESAVPPHIQPVTKMLGKPYPTQISGSSCAVCLLPATMPPALLPSHCCLRVDLEMVILWRPALPGLLMLHRINLAPCEYAWRTVSLRPWSRCCAPQPFTPMPRWSLFSG